MSTLNGNATRLRERLAPATSHIRWKPETSDWVTVHEPLDDETLRRHADGKIVVGSLPSADGVAREGLIDFDLHLDRDPTAEEVAKVEDYAKKKHKHLTGGGVSALLLRHHAFGSYHIRYFVKPLTADRLGRWLAWFVADAGEVDVEGFGVDTFPSSSSTAGNAVRLPGKHHKRQDSWTAVWDGTTWQQWPAALTGLLELQDNEPRHFPDPGKPKDESGATAPGGTRPGDILNLLVPVEDALGQFGWTFERDGDEGRTYITRPGKDGGVSASVKDGTVWVFTSSVPGLPASEKGGKPYTAFALVAYLQYGGDFSRAAAELARSGFCKAPAGVSVNSVSAWPDPVPLTEAPEVPEYPVDVLPPWLRAWAEAVALELQVPVDLPAALGLGLIGAGIGRKFVVRPRDGFTELTNQYVMPALPPGERKTQTFKKAMAPVLELERELVEAAAPLIQEKESEYRIAEKLVKNLEEKIAKPNVPDKGELREKLKQARAELLKIEVPPKPLLYAEDDTPESLKLELVRQGGRMMVASTEAKCLENITLYSDKPNFDVYLKGHAGDEIKSGRIGRGRDSVTEPALSCLLSPQPEVLRGLASNEVLRGRGFLGRWYYQLPKSNVGSRVVGAPAVPEAVQAAYHARIKAAWQTDYADGGAPHVLTFDAEARAEFEAFERWQESQLGPRKPLTRLAGWGNKLNGACARLAAALHIGDALAGSGDVGPAIGLDPVRRAVRLCRDYYVAHAVAAFDLMGANPVVRGARGVWAWIRSENCSQFTVRDAFRACQSAFEKVDELQLALDLLERHFLIRPPSRGDGKRDRGRPASPVYEVNPNGVTLTATGDAFPHEEVL